LHCVDEVKLSLNECDVCCDLHARTQTQQAALEWMTQLESAALSSRGDGGGGSGGHCSAAVSRRPPWRLRGGILGHIQHSDCVAAVAALLQTEGVCLLCPLPGQQ
jgi:hypothetical protein